MNTRRTMSRTKVILLGIPLVVIVLVLVAAAVGAVTGTDAGDGFEAIATLPDEGLTRDGSEPGYAGTGVVSTDGDVQAAGDKSAGDVAPLEEPLAYGPDPLEPSRFIIRTGDMTVFVEEGKVGETAARVTTLAAGLNGYVASSQIALTREGDRPFAAVTVRIPSRGYEQAIARFGALGTVDSLNTSSQDVTGEYVDVEARLKHQRAVVRRLLGFLSRTTTIGEAMAVQQKVDAAQLKVEQLSAQLKSLRNQAAYGTLTVNITEPPEGSQPAESENRFIAALGDSWDLIVGGFAAIIVALGAVLPFFVLLAAIAALVMLGIRTARRLRRRAAPAA